MKRFDALDLALALASVLRPTLDSVQRRDRDLFGQLRRAAASVPSCIAEGAARTDQDRTQLYRVAAGSLAEVRVHVALARAWGYTATAQAAAVEEVADRLAAVLYRLTHPR